MKLYKKMCYKFLAIFFMFVATSSGRYRTRFNTTFLTLNVAEERSPGYVIVKLSLHVIDKDPNKSLRYWIDGDESQKFEVNEKTGNVSVKGKLDRENKQLYRFNAHIADTAQQLDSILLYVTVFDVNDNAPVFQGTNLVEVYENAPIKSTILTLKATDADFDTNAKIFYLFQSPSETFGIDAFSGNITLKKSLDFEKKKSYTLRVIAADKGTPSLNTTAILTINVLDVNDTDPIFQSSPYNVLVNEDVPLGLSILKVHAFDGDVGINAAIIYRLQRGEDSDKFSVNTTSGIISIQQHLDRETKYAYRINVDAIERDYPSSATSVVVVIFTQDVNDNKPMFTSSQYEIIIDENTPIGSIIKQGFRVTDADILPDNNQFEFSLVDVDDNFAIESTTGHLSVEAVMDYERRNEFIFTVVATETLTSDRFFGNATVIVKLKNINDNNPVFERKQYSFEQKENASVGHLISGVKASDNDLGTFGIVTYSLEGGDASLFQINRTSGFIYVNAELDFETRPSLEFRVVARDGASFNQKTDVASVNVTLTDVNDNSPAITNLPATTRVNENIVLDNMFTVVATDADTSVNSNLLYMITNTSRKDTVMSINATTGVVKLLHELDYEQIQSLWIEITVKDQGVPSLESHAILTIDVKDMNDNTPVLNQSVYSGVVSEVAGIGTTVVQVFATDKDTGTNGLLKYNIQSGNEDSSFEISIDGTITTRNILDREKRDMFNLTVIVQDGGSPMLESECSVIIQVLDHNDRFPIFTKAQYSAEIIESAAIGTVVVVVSAVDQDIGSNGAIVYSIQSGNERSLFNINSTTGEIFVATQLDWENVQLFTFIVKAEDLGSQPNARTAVVTIKILDDNDNAPVFLKNTFNFKVFENFPEQTTIGLVSATDIDGKLPPNMNGIVTYNITGGNWNDSFAIDSIFGTIRTNKILDHETIPFYNLTITATDGGTPALSSSIFVVINVQDINDNQPIFSKPSYSGVVSENATFGTEIVQVFATDADEGTNGDITYSLSSTNHLFAISQNGIVMVKGVLDYETTQSFSLMVIAQDSAVSRMTSTVPLLINITDVNDNAPIFKHQPYEATVKEARRPGEIVFVVSADDVDTGTNAEIVYSIVQSFPFDGVFLINSSTGVVITNVTINRDINQKYIIEVEAEDKGLPSLASKVNITIQVIDSNTHAPVVHNLPSFINVSEAITQGIEIFKVNASDKDSGNNAKLHFYIISGADEKFLIDVNSGIIKTSSIPTDCEVKCQYNLTIEVVDGGNPSLKASSILTIHITDINDNTPFFIPNPNLFPQSYIASIKEGSKNLTKVIHVHAEDRDKEAHALISYSIAEDSGDYFSINSSNGVVLLKRNIDREARNIERNLNGFGVVYLVVTATDFSPPFLNTSVKVTVLIGDVNDNAPVFTKPLYTVTVTEGASIGTDVATVQALDVDLGFNAQVSYFIVKGNIDGSFQIDRTSGKISVAKQLNKETVPVWNLTIMAQDGASLIGEKPLNSTAIVLVLVSDINDNDPVFDENFYTAIVVENVDIGTFVKNVTATDADSGDNGRVWYEIISGNINNTFKIDNVTGEIFTQASINYEAMSTFSLVIKAEDFGNQAPRRANVELVITITDINDNKPMFPFSQYIGTMAENQPIKTKIRFPKPITATDADKIDQSLLKYKLTGPDSMYFNISAYTADITSNIIFDRELKDVYNFTIYVEDTGGFSSQANITVLIQDENDNTPQFNVSSISIRVYENIGVHTAIYTVKATDVDEKQNGDVVYFMQGGLGDFEIDQKTGVIRSIALLDREMKSSYVLIVVARDKGTPQKQANFSITVLVSDTFDSRPFFKPTEVSINVMENTKVGEVVFVASARDNDLDDVLTYSVTSETNSFRINSTTGKIFLLKMLDRERKSLHTVTIQATDSVGFKSASAGLTLTINILDVNDNKPNFTISKCGSDVNENAQNDTILLTVSATDIDIGLNAEITYTLSSNVVSLLSIDPTIGLIKKIGNFQPYVSSFINFTVFAQDKGDTPQVSRLDCSLNIIDVNNNSPQFNRSNYEVHVMEDASIGTVVATFTASEKDQGDNALITYSFVDSNRFFGVNATTGAIRIIRKLDREEQHVIFVKLMAQDNGVPPLQGVTSITFYITDINDETPTFTYSVYQFYVDENAIVGTQIGGVSALDEDVGQNAVVQYALNSNTFQGQFAINRTTGVLYTISDLDRETKHQFIFDVKAYDLGHPSLSSTVNVTVSINDVNDNYPQFNQTEYSVNIYEDTFGGSTVFVASASDADIGENGNVKYRITGGNIEQHFSIRENSGALVVIRELDIEKRVEYNLTVQAFDGGNPSLSNETIVTITLKDVNDNKPIFPTTSYTFTVYENVPVNSIVGDVTATDNDVSSLFHFIHYRVEKNDAFTINSNNGSLLVGKPLDRESTDNYVLTVTAYNLENGVESLNSKVDVTVKVLDVNDNPPVFPPSCCHVNISEGLQPNKLVFKFEATDKDIGSNSLITYKLLNERDLFILSATSGELKLKTPLNRELRTNHMIYVTTTDHGNPSLSANVTLLVYVDDVNDEAPVFLNMTVEVPREDSPVGTYIATFTANDEDLGSNQRISYSIIAGNENGDLILNSTTGVLRTAKLLDYETKPFYKLQVKAIDHGVPPLSVDQSFEIPVGNINDNVPSFGSVVPSGNVRENSPIGTLVTTIHAIDADGDAIYYYIKSGNEDGSFTLSSTTGVLKTAKILDHEVKSQYSLLIEASDVVTSQKRKRKDVRQKASSSVHLVITIEDENDNPPRFLKNLFSGGVSESATYGTSILQLQASDKDTSDKSGLRYEVIGGSSVFEVHPITGWIRSKALFAGLTGKMYKLNVIVKDNNGQANYFTDTAVTKIYVLTDMQRIVLTMKTKPALAKQHQQEFIDILENVTRYTINIDEIQYATKSEGAYDFTRTTLLFHAVDPTTNDILDRDVVIKKINDNYALLEAFFDKWNVTKYEGKVSAVTDTKDDGDDTPLKIVIAVIAFIVLLFLIFVLLVCKWRKRQNRKLKAVTTSAKKSDAELMTIMSPSMHTQIPGLPDTFTYDTEPTMVKVDTYAIPEDFNDGARKSLANAKFSTFYGGNTLEPKDQNGGSLYLDHFDDEEDLKKTNTLTVLDVIATQEYESQKVVGLDNKGVDEDDYFTESEDGQSQTTESTADFDHVVPQSTTRRNNNNNNNRNDAAVNSFGTVRKNGMLVTSM